MNALKVFLVIMLSLLVVVCAVLFATANRGISDGARSNALANASDSGQRDTPLTPEEALAPSDDGTVQTFSNSKIGWGIGPGANVRGQPVDCLRAQEKYGDIGGQFIFPEDGKTIYLTFDLGYENGYTEVILDALDERDVKGTFFVTMDYVRDAPDIVQRIIDGGHTLGNHSTNHPSMPDLEADALRAEIMELHNYVLKHFNYEMTLFRFPMGEFSEFTVNFIDDLGYKSIFWSFAYVDWKTDAQPAQAASLEKITGALHPGAIYLLHAVSSTNAAIMGDFVDRAAADGYRFGLVDARLGLVRQPAGAGSIY